MANLWMGAEDVDFPNGVAVNTTAAYFRAGWARCSIGNSSGSSGSFSKSTVFPGGAVTSAWLAFRFSTNSSTIITGTAFCGLGKSGTNAGIFLGYGVSGGAPFLTIVKYDGTTYTTLATSSGVWVANTTPIRIDMQVVSYGATGTVNVYVNGAQVLTYTGNIAVSGVTNLDSVFIIGNGNGASYALLSEMFVDSASTLGLQGLWSAAAPAGNGATQQFSNPAFTNFNPTTINDANSTFTNTTAQDEQATLQSIPSGNFQINSVKVVARAMATAGAASTNIKLGFNNTNTSVVAVSASQAVTTAFEPYEEYFLTDPTSAGGTGAWGTSLSGYELDIRSA